MSFATFSFLWMVIFNYYFNPELPPSTANNSTETTTDDPGITTIPASITGTPHMSTTQKPEKPTFTVPGLIFGSGNGDESDNENGGGSSDCGSLTLTVNEEESTQSPGYQEEYYYKRWECLWPETQCQRSSARRYCAKGCLAKFSTVTTKCFDGCCRCLIFTSESPTPENQQYYSF